MREQTKSNTTKSGIRNIRQKFTGETPLRQSVSIPNRKKNPRQKKISPQMRIPSKRISNWVLTTSRRNQLRKLRASDGVPNWLHFLSMNKPPMNRFLASHSHSHSWNKRIVTFVAGSPLIVLKNTVVFLWDCITQLSSWPVLEKGQPISWQGTLEDTLK